MPSWVKNDDIWAKAKKAALKTYTESEPGFWGAVTQIYKKMGGSVGASEAKSGDVVRAAKATGTPSHREQYDKMTAALNEAIARDERFVTPPVPDRGCYCTPWVVDILLAGKEGEQYEAVISISNGYEVKSKLVRLGFTYDAKQNTVTLDDGEPKPTNRTTVYSRLEAEHDDAVKAKIQADESERDIVHCRAHSASTAKLAEWVQGQKTEFMWMPAGLHTICAGFRDGSIELNVAVDEKTVAAVQSSLDDWRKDRPKQEPFGCVEHREQEASVRVTKACGFAWKKDGIYLAAEPTKLGAENVNGKVHRSWSPSFTTDAEYSKAVESGGMLRFPDGVRGSASNPATITGVDFCVGTLTNKPAFLQMSPVRTSEKKAEANPVVDEPITAKKARSVADILPARTSKKQFRNIEQILAR